VWQGQQRGAAPGTDPPASDVVIAKGSKKQREIAEISTCGITRVTARHALASRFQPFRMALASVLGSCKPLYPRGGRRHCGSTRVPLRRGRETARWPDRQSMGA